MTDDRIVIVSGSFSRGVKSLNLRTLPDVEDVYKVIRGAQKAA